MKFYLSLFTVALIVASCSYNKGELPEPVEKNNSNNNSSAITYNDHTKRLFDAYCISCHAPGATQGNFPLTNFSEVSAYSGTGGLVQIRVLDQANMPPTGSANGQLTQAEKDTLQMWINQGAPEL